MTEHRQLSAEIRHLPVLLGKCQHIRDRGHATGKHRQVKLRHDRSSCGEDTPVLLSRGAVPESCRFWPQTDRCPRRFSLKSLNTMYFPGLDAKPNQSRDQEV